MILISRATQKSVIPCKQPRLLVMFPEGLGDSLIFSEIIASRIEGIDCPVEIVVKSEVQSLIRGMGHSYVYSYTQLSELSLETYSTILVFNPNLKPEYDGLVSSFKGQVERYFMLPTPLKKYRGVISKVLHPWTCYFIDNINELPDSPVYSFKMQNEKNTWLISTHSSLTGKQLSLSFVNKIIGLARRNKKHVFLLTEYEMPKLTGVTVSTKLDLLSGPAVLKKCEFFFGIDSFVSHFAKRYISDVYIIGELGNRSTYRYHGVHYFGSDIACHDCMWLCHKPKRFECIKIQEQELLTLLEFNLGRLTH